jgi:putative RNA 2'-phosphotransferase
MGSAPHPLAKLAKILTYVLERRPDEFGLIPDSEGFVKTKALLQALSEDPEFRFVRQSHLNELGISIAPPVIELRDNLIRARNRSQLPAIRTPSALPKLLYIGIRQRAYPVIIEKGILPLGGLPHVVLTADAEFARRLGRRIDNDPILLTVQTAAATDAGIAFHQFGDRLFLAAHIPPGIFTGPPLVKEEAQPEKPKKAPVPDKPKTPGSFFPELSPDHRTPVTANRPRRNEMEWKKERRKARKEKQRGWT